MIHVTKINFQDHDYARFWTIMWLVFSLANVGRA